MAMNIQETVNTWTIKEFAGRLKEMLSESLPGYSLQVQEVQKNNGILLTGMAVQEPGSTVAPVLYLEELYARCEAGEPMEQLRDAFLKDLRSCRIPGKCETGQFQDPARIRDQLCLCLVNAAANSGRLAGIPHRPFHDLAVTYYIRLWDGAAIVTVHDGLLEQWGMDEGELYALALRNTRKTLGLSVDPLLDAICRITGTPAEKDEMPMDPAVPLYLAGAASGRYGACAILYGDILENFARRTGGDFYILPSSIHEALFLPAGDRREDPSGLLEMVREINRTKVEPGDVLSDNVYLYHRQERRLEMLAE